MTGISKVENLNKHGNKFCLLYQNGVLYYHWNLVALKAAIFK